MKVWRLTRSEFARLDGTGARLYGGRWNRVGLPVVYASEHLSLALIEIVVHLELPAELLPTDYAKIEIDLPDDVAYEKLERLPASASSMLEAGNRWFEAGVVAALFVPSVIVLEENNVLFNPTHRDFAKVKAQPPRRFTIDQRLLSRSFL